MQSLSATNGNFTGIKMAKRRWIIRLPELTIAMLNFERRFTWRISYNSTLCKMTCGKFTGDIHRSLHCFDTSTLCALCSLWGQERINVTSEDIIICISSIYIQQLIFLHNMYTLAQSHEWPMTDVISRARYYYVQIAGGWVFSFSFLFSPPFYSIKLDARNSISFRLETNSKIVILSGITRDNV